MESWSCWGVVEVETLNKQWRCIGGTGNGATGHPRHDELDPTLCQSRSAENDAGRTLIAIVRFERESWARYTSPIPPAASRGWNLRGQSFMPEVSAMSARHCSPCPALGNSNAPFLNRLLATLPRSPIDILSTLSRLPSSRASTVANRFQRL
jgi:hypothetical protein